MTVNTETKALQTRTSAPSAPATQTQPQIEWHRPAVDVLESPDGLLLVLDVPGVPADAFAVAVDNRTLTVSGVRTDGVRGWRRAFTLAPTIDSTGIVARAEHGVLQLTLPKVEAAKPRRITVV
jgi:HSP20 family protein